MLVKVSKSRVIMSILQKNKNKSLFKQLREENYKIPLSSRRHSSSRASFTHYYGTKRSYIFLNAQCNGDNAFPI